MIFSISFRKPIRVRADSQLEAFQKLAAIVDKSLFYVSEVSQETLDEELAFEQKVAPLLAE